MKLDGSKKNMFKLLESIDNSFKPNLNEISPEYAAKKTMTGYRDANIDPTATKHDTNRIANVLQKSINANLKNMYGTKIAKLYVITNATANVDDNDMVIVGIDLQLLPQYEDYDLGDGKKLEKYLKNVINIWIQFDNRTHDDGTYRNAKPDVNKPYDVKITLSSYLYDIMKHFGDRSDLGIIRQIIRKLIPNYNISLNDIPINVNNKSTDQNTMQQNFDNYKNYQKNAEN